jgi:hypothetical protein
MDTGDWAAWTGAATGIVALSLQAYQHLKRGPANRMEAHPNNVILELGKPPDLTRYIVVEVTNTGDSKTTLQNFELYVEPAKEKRLLAPSPVTYVPNQTFGEEQGKGYDPLPFALNVGDIWQGKIPQDAEMLKMARGGRATVRLFHSASTKPLEVEIKFE